MFNFLTTSETVVPFLKSKNIREMCRDGPIAVYREIGKVVDSYIVTVGDVEVFRARMANSEVAMEKYHEFRAALIPIFDATGMVFSVKQLKAYREHRYKQPSTMLHFVVTEDISTSVAPFINDASTIDVEGLTPLALAAKMSHKACIDRIIELASEADLKKNMQILSSKIKFKKKLQTLLEQRSTRFRPLIYYALESAVSNNSLEMVNFLIDELHVSVEPPMGIPDKSRSALESYRPSQSGNCSPISSLAASRSSMGSSHTDTIMVHSRSDTISHTSLGSPGSDEIDGKHSSGDGKHPSGDGKRSSAPQLTFAKRASSFNELIRAQLPSIGVSRAHSSIISLRPAHHGTFELKDVGGPRPKSAPSGQSAGDESKNDSELTEPENLFHIASRKASVVILEKLFLSTKALQRHLWTQCISGNTPIDLCPLNPDPTVALGCLRVYQKHHVSATQRTVLNCFRAGLSEAQELFFEEFPVAENAEIYRQCVRDSTKDSFACVLTFVKNDLSVDPPPDSPEAPPIHSLCRKNLPELVKLMLCFGADAHRLHEGMNAFETAKTAGSLECCKILCEVGGDEPDLATILRSENIQPVLADSSLSRRINILSLDGGGVRGLTQIVILAELERICGRNMWELFDFVAGTSIGSMLACSVGLGYDIGLDKLRTMYLTFPSEIFKGKRRLYSREPAEKMLEKLFDGRKMMDETSSTEENSRRLRTLCVACDSSTSHPEIFLFRNYLTDDGSCGQIDGTSTASIKEAVCASSAAPGYFTTFSCCIDGKVKQLLDGALLHNNPTIIALSETIGEPLGVVASFGTGLAQAERVDLNFDMFHDMSFTSVSAAANLYTKFRSSKGLGDLFLNVVAGSDMDLPITQRMVMKERHGKFFRFQPVLVDGFCELDDWKEDKLLALMWEVRKFVHTDSENILSLCRALLANPRHIRSFD
eukprot:635472_1